MNQAQTNAVSLLAQELQLIVNEYVSKSGVADGDIAPIVFPHELGAYVVLKEGYNVKSQYVAFNYILSSFVSEYSLTGLKEFTMAQHNKFFDWVKQYVYAGEETIVAVYPFCVDEVPLTGNTESYRQKLTQFMSVGFEVTRNLKSEEIPKFDDRTVFKNFFMSRLIRVMDKQQCLLPLSVKEMFPFKDVFSQEEMTRDDNFVYLVENKVGAGLNESFFDVFVFVDDANFESLVKLRNLLKKGYSTNPNMTTEFRVLCVPSELIHLFQASELDYDSLVTMLANLLVNRRLRKHIHDYDNPLASLCQAPTAPYPGEEVNVVIHNTGSAGSIQGKPQFSFDLNKAETLLGEPLLDIKPQVRVVEPVEDVFASITVKTVEQKRQLLECFKSIATQREIDLTQPLMFQLSHLVFHPDIIKVEGE